MSLSSEFKVENGLLIRRVAQLESQLEMTSLAHREEMRRSISAEGDSQRVLGELNRLQEGATPLFVAFIDGEVLTFDPALIGQGHAGGKYCAERLKDSITLGLGMMGDPELARLAQPDKATFQIFYMIDHVQMERTLKSCGHYKAAAGLHDFTAGFFAATNAVVLDLKVAQRRKKLSELVDLFGKMPSVRRLFMGGSVPPPSMRPWTGDFTAVDHPALNKFCLLLAPGITDRFSDRSFSSSDSKYYTRLEIDSLFTLWEPELDCSPSASLFPPLDAATNKVVRVTADDDSFNGSLRMGKPWSVVCSSYEGQSLLERSPISEAGSNLTFEDIYMKDDRSCYSPMRYPGSPALGIGEGPDLSPESRRQRNPTAPAIMFSSRKTPPSENCHMSDDDDLPSNTVPGMPGHQRSASTGAPLRRSRGITYASVIEEERASGKKHPEFANAPRVDLSVPLSKQKIPPCNNFYLSRRGCTNPQCKYAHGYRLSALQLDELSKGARHAKCHFLKRGEICPAGDDCIFGLHDRN